MNKDNERQGRPLEQQTRDGSTSAGSYGAGSTGNISQQTHDGNTQSGGRTVDLLSNGSQQEEDAGYHYGGSADLQTGLGGIGTLSGSQAGNRQSEGQSQPGGRDGAMQGGQGSEGSAIPESGGQRTRKED
ncbi:hypothetical protein [Pseudoduganella rhizocola]|uniref:hypothetical protein n=1 Tax=Pseudoduganella rhizocola TaxID=3382643 RepID=UPI0038B5B1F5